MTSFYSYKKIHIFLINHIEGRHLNKEKILRDYNKIKYSKLAACIAIDLIGMSSFVVPVLGEAPDLLWAPISGIATFLLFRGKIGAIGGVGNSIEEILPATDIIPGATLTWFTKYVLMKKETLTEYLDNLKEEIDLVNEYSK